MNESSINRYSAKIKKIGIIYIYIYIPYTTFYQNEELLSHAKAETKSSYRNCRCKELMRRQCSLFPTIVRILAQHYFVVLRYHSIVKK